LHRKHFGKAIKRGCFAIPLQMTLLILVSFLACPSYATSNIEFPGPVQVDISGAGLCMMAVPAEQEGQQDLLVATEDGYLAIVNYAKYENSFRLWGRTHLGGQLVGMVPWEGYQGDGLGVVLASREPDQVHFITVTPTAPYFNFVQTIALPEDPGGMAFAGSLTDYGPELGITLPGVDQILFLARQNDSWFIKQTLACGDTPADLVGIDTDGDQVKEFVSANQGALSHGLSVFHQTQGGNWELSSHFVHDGSPRRLATFDLDLDGDLELVVAYEDRARIEFVEVQDNEFSQLGSVPLLYEPKEICLERDGLGLVSLYVSHEEQGLIEVFQGQDFPFSNLENYYPGCQPKQLTLCDFSGDAKGDLIALGAMDPLVSVLFRHKETEFWGYPALPMTTEPGAGVFDDFNGDGFTDLVVTGRNESKLDFFAGTGAGTLEKYPETQDFPNLLSNLVSIQIDADPALELAAIDLGFGLIRILDFVSGTEFVEISNMPLGYGALGLLSADCDGDGLDDLVGVSPFNKTVKIYYGLAGGLFTDPVEVVFDGQVRGVEVIDLTADGLLDLIVTDSITKVYTAKNLGNREYQPYSWSNAGAGALYIGVGDFDNDLDNDVVIGNTSDESLSYLENMGDGSLQTIIASSIMPEKPTGLTCADFNLDGLVDIAVNFGVEGELGIILGEGDWQFGFAQTIDAGTTLSQMIVDDFNNDFVPDIFVLGGEMSLGLTILNVEMVMVAVEPSALAAQCRNLGLDIDVSLPGGENWTLAIGGERGWQTVAHDGEAVLGSCLYDRGRWRIELSRSELKAIENSAGSLGSLDLRLIVGSDFNAEDLTLELAEICQYEEQALPGFVPSWVQAPYPNPFNPSMQAEFYLARAGQVQAIILDVRGRKVASLMSGARAAGTHLVSWDGRSDKGFVGAGVYFLRITTEFGVLSQKVMLLK